MLDPGWAASSLVNDVRRGLATQPRTLPPKWLYDDRGSDLFDQITRLPEYYPTEAERALLVAHADEIVQLSGADTVVELGSGTSDKTRTLLDAFTAHGPLTRFVPVDVSEGTLRTAAAELVAALSRVCRSRPSSATSRCTSATCPPAAARSWPSSAAPSATSTSRSGPRSSARWPTRWRSATACCWAPTWSRPATGSSRPTTTRRASRPSSSRNCLHVVNRELGADFDVDAFSYVPFWDPHMERMDLRLRAEMPQRVTIPGADVIFDLASGEEIRVEISTKFRPDQLRNELHAAGFAVEQLWSDADFALTLARRAG